MATRGRRSKQKRGFKACDPFCTDKVRVALYKRPNGPHMGKLNLGKSYISGIDDKCFSRTGRMKKGYRNIPVDLQREFEIEKRQIQEIRSMIRGPKKLEKKRKLKRRRQQQAQIKARKAKLRQVQKVATEKSKSLGLRLAERYVVKNKGAKNKNKNPQKQRKKAVESMDKLKRKRDEPLSHFIRRVHWTSKWWLKADENKKMQALALRREKREEENKAAREKSRQRQRQEDEGAERTSKMERGQQKAFERRLKADGQKEHIPFGATNARPPVNLHELGADLFGKRRGEHRRKRRRTASMWRG